MNKKLLFPLAIGLAAFTYSKSKNRHNHDLAVVPHVDLNRYSGKWYEIARLPDWFEKKCASDVTATYEPLVGGKLKVINECRNVDGQIERAEAVACRQSKSEPNSKLKVSFAPAWLSWLPSVWGSYWIINLAPDYSYALVGTPDRKYFWILSRTPNMADAIYRRLCTWAETRGFAVNTLVKTQHGSLNHDINSNPVCS